MLLWLERLSLGAHERLIRILLRERMAEIQLRRRLTQIKDCLKVAI
jgi:hypothetical protein